MDKAGDILKQFLDKQSLKAAKDYSSFFRSWETIAGEDTAAHSRILDIRKKTLIIEVDHPAWIQMLQMRYNEILNSVQKHFPELVIEKMHLKLGHSAAPAEKPETKTSEKRAAGASQQSGQTESGDQNLKEALERLKKSIDEKERRSKR